MRLVSWNLCDRFNSKFGHLERLRPDIAVVQEVRPGCLDFAGLNDRALWLGDDGQKGLAAIGYGDWRLSPGPAVPERWFLPFVATNGVERLHIVAVWADSATDCGAATLSALAALEPFIRAAPSCLAGDFNQCVAVDARKPIGRRFIDVLSRLETLGMSSAWHAVTGEAYGAETRASYYWRWNPEAPFHIDFAFTSEKIAVREVMLGAHDAYLRISDHMPLIVDCEIVPRPGSAKLVSA